MVTVLLVEDDVVGVLVPACNNTSIQSRDYEQTGMAVYTCLH